MYIAKCAYIFLGLKCEFPLKKIRSCRMQEMAFAGSEFPRFFKASVTDFAGSVPWVVLCLKLATNYIETLARISDEFLDSRKIEIPAFSIPCFRDSGF
jgi:hypothetical protein